MRSAIHNIARSDRGNVAMMFGLFLIPLVAAVGVGVDMVRFNHVQTDLNEAADSAVLAGARAKMLDDKLSDAQSGDIARKHFDANRAGLSEVQIDTFGFTYDASADTYAVTTTGRVKTAILGVIGRDYSPFTIFSEAKVAPPRILETVLVLDTTGSMSGAKLTALKDAANDLVDTIMKDKDNTVKVGIVPFSQYVNVGVSRRNEWWIDVKDDYTTTAYKCWNTYPDKTTSNCTSTASTCTSNNDGVVTTYACTKTTCDTDWGEPVEACGNITSSFAWYGCAGSRDNPLDEKDKDFDKTPVPGLMNDQCSTGDLPRELLPLSTDKSAVEAKIDSMVARGQTYVPSGLTWGLRLISPTEPFAEGETYENIALNDGVKAMILMTDGANTKSATYPRHDGSDGAGANKKTEAICKDIKKENIVLYTIAFEVSDSAIRDLLEDCATEPDAYFNADNAEALAEAFQAIANNLQELALSR